MSGVGCQVSDFGYGAGAFASVPEMRRCRDGYSFPEMRRCRDGYSVPEMRRYSDGYSVPEMRRCRDGYSRCAPRYFEPNLPSKLVRLLLRMKCQMKRVAPLRMTPHVVARGVAHA